MKTKLNETSRIKLDKLIGQFEYAYMSNAKWKKVFTEILKNKDIIKQCEIYDFINPCINEINFDNLSDNSFNEINNEYISNKITTGEHPTNYKYIEYITFLKEWVALPYALAQQTVIKQNTDTIKIAISKIGLFEWEENDKSLKILGYRKNHDNT